jgi:hypothetical protein
MMDNLRLRHEYCQLNPQDNIFIKNVETLCPSIISNVPTDTFIFLESEICDLKRNNNSAIVTVGDLGLLLSDFSHPPDENTNVAMLEEALNGQLLFYRRPKTTGQNTASPFVANSQALPVVIEEHLYLLRPYDDSGLFLGLYGLHNHNVESHYSDMRILRITYENIASICTNSRDLRQKNVFNN